MRECELICKECLLNVIRESMPVEKILRAYLDETTEEEVIEEKVTEIIDSKKEEIEKAAAAVDTSTETSSADIKKELETTVQKKDLTTTENKILKELNNDIKQDKSNLTIATQEINTIPKVASAPAIINKTLINTFSPVKTTPIVKAIPIVETKPSNISFNDSDQVMNYNIVQSPKAIKKTVVDNILAPKTVDRLEEISKARHEQRKLEEAEEEDEDEEDKLTIHGDAPSLKLDALDINDIGDKLALKKEVIHDVIELK